MQRGERPGHRVADVVRRVRRFQRSQETSGRHGGGRVRVEERRGDRLLDRIPRRRRHPFPAGAREVRSGLGEASGQCTPFPAELRQSRSVQVRLRLAQLRRQRQSLSQLRSTLLGEDVDDPGGDCRLTQRLHLRGERAIVEVFRPRIPGGRELLGRPRVQRRRDVIEGRSGHAPTIRVGVALPSGNGYSMAR